MTMPTVGCTHLLIKILHYVKISVFVLYTDDSPSYRL